MVCGLDLTNGPSSRPNSNFLGQSHCHPIRPRPCHCQAPNDSPGPHRQPKLSSLLSPETGEHIGCNYASASRLLSASQSSGTLSPSVTISLRCYQDDEPIPTGRRCATTEREVVRIVEVVPISS